MRRVQQETPQEHAHFEAETAARLQREAEDHVLVEEGEVGLHGEPGIHDVLVPDGDQEQRQQHARAVRHLPGLHGLALLM